jgi:ABC-type transporter Mla MlaB component
MQAVAVPARIGVDNAVQVLAGLREATRGATGEPVALDLSALREFDSSALSLLLQLARDRTAPGNVPGTGRDVAGAGRIASPAAAGARPDAAFEALPLFLLNPPEKLRELAELYGVAQMLFGAGGGAAEQVQPG